MTENKAVIVGVLIDASGSMASRWNETIKGFNSYIRQFTRDHERDHPDLPVYFAVSTFDTQVREVHKGFGLELVPKLNKHNYRPGGMTALNDAFGQMISTLDEFESRYRLVGNKAAVICVVLTDGYENSSKENTWEDIREMITGRQDAGNWTFLYLAEDADAWDKSARMYNIPFGHTIAWGAKGASAAMAGMTLSTQDIVSNYASRGKTQTISAWADVNQKGELSADVTDILFKDEEDTGQD